ncbi:ion channel, partial [Escherichia coli]|nr:ion channel [Escherichia coli]
MSHWATFKQTATNLWVTLRHDILALAVLLNGVLMFKTIYGMSVNLLDIFHIKAFSELDLSLLANAPLFMLGVFLVLNSIGLLFRAKLAWAISIILLLIALIYTLHFYPWLKFSIGFCIFTLVLLLILRKDFSHSSSAAGTMSAGSSFTTLLLYSTDGALYLSEGCNPPIESLMIAFYFSIETMSTVGYGDIVPVSESARLCTISVIIYVMTVFATSMTSIFGPLIRGGFNKLVKGNNHTMHRKDHFIVCGHSILAINTLLQLNQLGQNVTVISNLHEDDITRLELRLGDNAADIHGDSTDSSALMKAGL